MRVLFVAFYFPPTAGGGIERTLGFCRHLPEHGIDVEVLVPTDARWLVEDPASLARVPTGLRVHRSRYRGPGAEVLPGDRIAAARAGPDRVRTRLSLLPRRLLVPDVEVAWLPDVIPAAARLLRSGRFDALLTTAPPHAVTLAGAALARTTRLPWVADWRDPWLAHPDRNVDRRAVRAKAAVSAPLARLAVRAMAGATCVNDAIAAEVTALRPSLPVEVVPNGADVERIVALQRRPAPRLTFLYSGYFFGDRGPAVFCEGLAAAIAAEPDLAEQIRVRFIGTFPAAVSARLAPLGLGDIVSLEGTQSHADVLQAQRDADVLLLFMQERAGSEAVVPAKTWEYLAAGRPVLALVPPDGAAAREIAGAAAGIVVAPTDVDAARAAISDLARRYREERLDVPGIDAATALRISRRGRAAQLAGLLHRVAG